MTSTIVTLRSSGSYIHDFASERDQRPAIGRLIGTPVLQALNGDGAFGCSTTQLVEEDALSSYMMLYGERTVMIEGLRNCGIEVVLYRGLPRLQEACKCKSSQIQVWRTQR